MKSPKIFSRDNVKRGFTMIEMLVAIGLLGILAALTVFIGYDSIARSSVYGERDTLVSLLTAARAKALANVDESAQGVHIEATKFVLFAGATYTAGASGNKDVPRTVSIIATGPSDVIFEQLSGDVSTGIGTIKLTQGAASTTIDINSAGRIDW